MIVDSGKPLEAVFSKRLVSAMGAQDAYPFVMPDAVLDKLAFIHKVIAAGVRGDVAMNFAAQDAATPSD